MSVAAQTFLFRLDIFPNFTFGHLYECGCLDFAIRLYITSATPTWSLHLPIPISTEASLTPFAHPSLHGALVLSSGSPIRSTCHRLRCPLRNCLPLYSYPVDLLARSFSATLYLCLIWQSAEHLAESAATVYVDTLYGFTTPCYTIHCS